MALYFINSSMQCALAVIDHISMATPPKLGHRIYGI